MNLNYNTDSTVVVTVFKVHKVGTVTERLVTKQGIIHSVKLEDGKTYDSLRINGDSECYINSRLTEAFNKSKEDDNR